MICDVICEITSQIQPNQFYDINCNCDPNPFGPPNNSELTHGCVDGPLVGVGGEGVDRLLVGRLEGPHVVEEGGGHVGVLHQVEV